MPLIPLVLVILVIYLFLQNPGIFLGIIYWGLGFLAIFFVVRKKRRKIQFEKDLQAEMEERQKILRSGIHKIDVMEGIEFEDFLEALFSEMGFKVETTSVTGDFGADLILTSDSQARIAVQAKRYSKPVGVEAIQEVYSARRYYDCNEAWVITNSKFTKSACELAKKSNVALIDREQLINLITRVRKAVSGL